MIVAVSRIPLPKTERYLYWVRVADKNRDCDTMCIAIAVLFLCSENGLTQGFCICFLQEVSLC